eukprot:g11969.t1
MVPTTARFCAASAVLLTTCASAFKNTSPAEREDVELLNEQITLESIAEVDPEWKNEVARLLGGVISGLERGGKSSLLQGGAATQEQKEKKVLSLLNTQIEKELDALVELAEQDDVDAAELAELDDLNETGADVEDYMAGGLDAAAGAGGQDQDLDDQEEDEQDRSEGEEENENENAGIVDQDEEAAKELNLQVDQYLQAQDAAGKTASKYIPEATKKEVAKILNGIIGRLSKGHF